MVIMKISEMLAYVCECLIQNAKYEVESITMNVTAKRCNSVKRLGSKCVNMIMLGQWNYGRFISSLCSFFSVTFSFQF